MKQKKKKIQAQNDLAVRHQIRHKRRKRITNFGRFTLFMMFLAATVVVVAFFTPVFNIKTVKVEGNMQVNSETIIAQSGIVEGQNLFKVNISQIKNSVESIPYIDSVSIKRVLIPPTLCVQVSESTADAYVEHNGIYLLIDRKSNILEEISSPRENIPKISGLNLKNYTVGSKLEIDESEKSDIILICIDTMEQQGLLSEVDSIVLDSVTDFSFIYQNRLTVKCGSALDLKNKLTFFNGIINSGRLTENSRGTLDISTSGKAIYTP